MGTTTKIHVKRRLGSDHHLVRSLTLALALAVLMLSEWVQPQTKIWVEEEKPYLNHMNLLLHHPINPGHPPAAQGGTTEKFV